MRRAWRISALLLILLLLADGLVSAQPPSTLPSAAAPAARQGPPAPDQGDPYLTPIRDGGFSDYIVGGGFLYYTVGDDLVWSFFRQPENGGPAITLSTLTATYPKAADDAGVYYDKGLLGNPQQLMTRQANHPDVEITLADLSNGIASHAVTDETYVYYTLDTGIYRALKDAAGGTRISDATGVTEMAVDDTNIYWLDSTALWRSPKTCTSSACWSNKVLVCSVPGEGLSWSDPTHLLYTGYGTTPDTWNIMQAEAGGTNSCYWLHYVYQFDATLYHAAVSEGYLFWVELLSGYPEYMLRRCAVSDYCANVVTLYEGDLETDRLFATSGGVIFGDHTIASLGIYRMSYDAPALLKDLKLLNIEVTQAIQDLDVDEDSPLIAGKPTYVRVYSTLLDTRTSNAAEVWLECPPSGVPCYTPYLKPLQWEDVPSNLTTPDRSKGAWLFLLPEEWTTGQITLRAEIDPRHIYDDPTPANNVIATTVTFHSGTPVCTVVIPVRTPAGKGSKNNSTFWSMVDRAWRMWPTSEIRVYSQSEPVEELEFCWWGIFPGWCWGPYELKGDSSWILNTLRDRDNLSDDPDECDDAGARTHYIGLVHENSKTEGVNGAARIGADGSYDCDQIWVWLSQPAEVKSSEPWTYPRAGGTFGHELAHNYERMHVKCPVVDPPADPDPNYPYDTCMIDDGDLDSLSTHFGFDTLTQLPINPHSTRDLLAYGTNRWPSDYTWRGMYNNLGLQSSAQEAAAAGPDLAQAGSAVLVTGIFTPSLGQGQMGYAWVYPTARLSAGILRKWQRMAAPMVDQVTRTTADLYHLRLLDAAGNIVDDRVITPTETVDGPENTLFSLAFPAPAAEVVQLQLLINDTVVDSLYAGPQPPTVQIVEPAGGGTFDQDMTLIWEASDPDSADLLLHTVQYSPDNGQTWKALVTNLPSFDGGERVTLTLTSFGGLPGGSSALVRVAASDGYHTGLATSDPFQVLNRAPEPYVVSPLPGEELPAGQPFVLRGGATDAEDGSVDSSVLEWDLSVTLPYQGAEVTPIALPPGTYPITLTAEDSDGLTGATYATLTIAPLDVPRASGGAPELDGYCDDGFYTRGVVLPLRAYADGGQPVAHMVRTLTDLYVCISGMERGYTETLISFAGLVVDVDEDGGQHPQADDRGFVVYEDGSPATWTGSGSGWVESPADMSARVAGNDNAWSAELRIDRTDLGGWNNVVLLSVFHAYMFPGGALQSWPELVGYGQPNSWGRAIFGQVPEIDLITPTEAIAGHPVQVTLHGTGIEDSIAYVLWNGVQRLGLVANGVVTPALWLSDFATAGVVEVRVDNFNGGPGDESNPLFFTIWNPTPTLSLLTPASVEAGSPDLDLVVDGADFVPGAAVLWNGEALATTFITTTRLQATVPAAALAAARTVPVTVANPDPSLAVSNEASFQIVRAPAPYQVYLPIVMNDR